MTKLNCKIAAAVLPFLFCFCQVSVADIFYEESVSGDLSNSLSSPTVLGTLPFLVNDVLGSVDGDAGANNDEFDFFEFTSNAKWEMDLSALSLTGTSSLLVVLWDENGNLIDIQSRNAPDSNLFGTFAPGTYILEAVPSGNAGQASYTYSINVVPEPGSLFVLVGLGMALGIRRRR